MAEQTWTGRVARIVYQDSVASYAVFDLETPDQGRIRVAGHALPLDEGLSVRVTGDFHNHPRFGRQVRATTVLVLPPEQPDAIAAYLCSGRVRGVGKELARRIVAFFGDRIREALDADAGALRACPGIGPARAAAIHEAWHREIRERETHVLLAGLGLTPTQVVKVMRAYGEEGPARVRENPYDLIRRISGIGFKTADAIAGRVGLAPDAPVRLRAAVGFVLGEAAEAGHVYLPEPELISGVAAVTGRLETEVRHAIEEAVRSREAVIEESPEGRIVFLDDLHRAEVEAARRLRQQAGQRVRRVPVPAGRIGRVPLARSQREALGILCDAAVAVLTGGPGTGKTTVIGALLALAAQAHWKVCLAAPTGRAAMRLKEATGEEARTIHRLLEFNPRTGRFARNELNPIDADWLVVDEASMLDIVLLAHLLRALSPGTRLTLVGDADQLPPVGPGDPFRDLIASGLVPVARLHEVFRQGEGSAIVQAAHEVRMGREPTAGPQDPDRPGDFYVVFREDPAEVASTVERLVCERIPARFALDPVREVQVLAPMHRGDCGTEALNRLLRARLNREVPREAAPERAGLRVGDRVLQTRNNYAKEVFNGDIGVVSERREDGGVRVQFEDRLVDFEPHECDDLGLAYAISVHKAQGSEFPAVVIALHTQHYLMLRRNLLYTALTRGRRLCVLVGSRRAIRLAVANDRVEVRNTRLARRLRDPAAE